jgi:3-isopropylmalate/(R)-2-methylmalate dehydratase small subunit
MKPLRRVTGTAVPLDRADVDTDQIIPSDWLKKVERTGFAEGLFAEWREDPSFVLNQDRFAGARILVAGPNFGTGSSREHATWALQDWGFDVVISPRFADIFRNNCTKIGLLPVVLPPEVVQRLLAAIDADPTLEVTVDVEERTVWVPGLDLSEPFPLDDFTRHRFLEGLDDVGLTLRHEDAIAAHEARRPGYLPTLT